VLVDVDVPNHSSIFAGALLALVGCAGDSIIPAHALSATLDVNGTTSTAALSFPAHDSTADHHPGDATCSLNSGNCGCDEPTVATVTGDAPIDSAWLVTIGGTLLTYYVTVRQPGTGDATCIVNESIGTPVPCDYGQGNVTLTLTPQ
jgi:hypothetical protein